MQNCNVAIDLGATNVRAALVSETGEILMRTDEHTQKQGSSGYVITEQIIRMVSHLLRDGKWLNVGGIGVASVGPLDHDVGGPKHSPNVPFASIPLLKPIEESFSLPVVLINDANAGVLAERNFGGGQSSENIVFVTISTGIGGGAIVNDHLLLGKSGNAAEVGHLIVDTTYDFPCTCQAGKGHWEGLASGGNLPSFFSFWVQQNRKPADFRFQEAKEIFEKARQGNRTALEFVDEVAKINSRAISNIIVTYDPDLITIGGSVALHNPNIILDGIKRHVDKYLEVPTIRITELGGDIGLLGAAAASFRDSTISQ